MIPADAPRTAVSPLAEAATLGTTGEDVLAGRRYGVRIGGQRLLLDSSGAVRVLDPPPVYRLPNTAPWCLGLANVRGSLIPVYDIALWQDLPAPESGRMLLVVGADDQAAATLVDVAPRYLVVPGTPSPPPALSAGFADFAREAYALEDGIWTDLDWDGLFESLSEHAVLAA